MSDLKEARNINFTNEEAKFQKAVPWQMPVWLITINSTFQWHHHDHRPTHQSEACIYILKYAIIANKQFKFTVRSTFLVRNTVIGSVLYIVKWFAWSGPQNPSMTFPSFPITDHSQYPETRQKPQLWCPGALPRPSQGSQACCNSLWLS